MAEIRIPTVLRPHVGGAASVRADGATVREVFDALSADYPSLRDHLITDEGTLHRFVNVYRNDDDVRYLDQLDTTVAPTDVISVLPAVAGGF
ncbi:MAG TPA: ubiquitin-like small modifier protein 1 [Acidimicrobiia bacterium]|nr:ubiquitin-like small modifier protein 1 [Acidimicrobiia bacterium]